MDILLKEVFHMKCKPAVIFGLLGSLAGLWGCGGPTGTVPSSLTDGQLTQPLAQPVLRKGGTFAAPDVAARADSSTNFRVTSDWGSGFGGALDVVNGSQPLTDWRLEFDFPYSIDSIWNARILSHSGQHYVLVGEDWNRDLAAGAQLSIGLNGSPGKVSGVPTNIVLLGATLATPSPSPSPTSTAAPASVGLLQASFSSTGDWGSGFQGQLDISNPTTQPVAGWWLEFDLNANISSLWNGQIDSHVGQHYRVSPASWSTTLPAQGKASIGFIASPGGASPSNLQVFTQTGSPSPSASPTTTPTTSPSPTASPTISPTTTPSPTASPPPTGQTSTGKVIAYFPEWAIYQRNYFVTNVPAASLNVLNYAFADISAAGDVTLFDSWAAVEKPFPGDTVGQPFKGNLNQLVKLKKVNPKLLTMISVGGWTLSGRFSDVALTSASRQHFAASAVSFMTKYGFDGVDIDWEFPGGGGLPENTVRPQDPQNFTLLLQELRHQLDQRGLQDGRRYYLSAALPAGVDKIVKSELVPMSVSLDWMNLMTPDFHGGWENRTDHHSPLHSGDTYSTETAVNTYLQAGVPASKLLLGVPTYGRSWKNVPVQGDGLFQSASGVPQGTFDDTGVFDYKDLVAKLASAPSTYIRHWDATAQSPWIYAPSLGVMISYEDRQSLQAKLDFLRQKGLAGVMLWDLSSDIADPNHPESLVGAARRGLDAK
nr:chitinase [uncultured bacterium]